MIPIEYYEELSKQVEFRGGIPYWIIQTRNKNRDLEQPAGVISEGYRIIRFTLNKVGKCIYVHRLHWFMVYGYIPKMLDHIDMDRSNNRIDNLREVTNGQNMRNVKGRGKSKYLGVGWNKKRNKWQVQTRHEKVTYYIGCFDKEEDAAKAYDQFCIDNNLYTANLNFKE